jgi:Domain of unknown function (DUF4185)
VRVGIQVIVLSVAVALGVLAASDGTIAPRAEAAIPAGPPAGFLANSTQAVCALTGTHGAYTELPPDYTANVDGIISGDAGSSFEFDNQVWWLFGNSGAATSPPWTSTNASSRWSRGHADPAAPDSDAIATSPITTAPAPVAPYNGLKMPPNQHCPVLTFVPRSGSKAYANPSVSPDPLFRGQDLPVSLRTGELPEAGIGEGNDMYVVFGTDNPANCAVLVRAPEHGPAPPPGPCPQPRPHHKAAKICASAKVKGSRTRSVVAARTANAGVAFTGLYDLSAPTQRYGPLCPRSPDTAKFVNVQIANGNDGYIYIWGTEGGAKNESSYVYLARILATHIASGDGLEYWRSGGWKSTASPADFVAEQGNATPLFTDTPAACAAQLGVQYNSYLNEWIILYKCRETRAPSGHPNGIYMRTAPAPSGPWSAPTTIFNPAPDSATGSGFCYFIYSTPVAKCPPSSPDASLPPPAAKKPQPGGYYGPYFVADWTTGTYAAYPTRASTTIYYTLDTYDPYGQVIMRSTILGPPLPSRPTVPTCKGTTCS